MNFLSPNKFENSVVCIQKIVRDLPILNASHQAYYYKNLEKNNGPRRNIVADYHCCNLIILLLENNLFTNGQFWLVGLVG